MREKGLDEEEAHKSMIKIDNGVNEVLGEYIRFAMLDDQQKEVVFPTIHAGNFNLTMELKELIEKKILGVIEEACKTKYKEIEGVFKNNIKKAKQR